VDAITEQWKEQQDMVGLFIAENLESTPLNEFVKMNDVYAKYEMWMASAGEHPWSKRSLTKDLEERGMPTTRDHHNGRLLWGWKIKESALTWPGTSV